MSKIFIVFFVSIISFPSIIHANTKSQDGCTNCGTNSTASKNPDLYNKGGAI